MKVNILLCDTFPGLLPDYIPSYVSMFTGLFTKVDAGTTYQVYNVFDEHFPDELYTDEIYLVTGSNAGVYEDIGWIKKLLAFIRQANEKQVPLIGICFGHQAIAQALGGKVMPAQQGWGTGIRQSTTLTEEAHKYFSKGIMELHYNHHDQVLTLPEGAVCFATSSFCPVEGFTIGNHILTFQGHPEYTTAYNRHLLINHAENEPMDVRTAALESFSHLNNMGTEAARWILTHHKKA